MPDSTGVRWAIAKRDLTSLSREKTIVLAILIQLFVAAFSSFLVVGLTSLYDPGTVESGAVTVGVSGEARDELVAAAREQSGISIRGFETGDRARGAFRNGRVDAVLVGTYVDAGDGPGRVIQVDATVPEGSLRTTLVVVQVREILEALERTERFERSRTLDQPPLPLPPGADASPYFAFTYTVLIPLLLFLPAFISGSLAVDSVTEEIERGTVELLRTAPVSLVGILDGKALAATALAPVQAALWIGLLALNGIGVANPLILIALVAAVAALLVTLGLVLGLWQGRRRPAQLLYSVGALSLFGVAVALPEHPAATVAKLAVDSPTAITHATVLGYLLGAVVLYALGRRYARARTLESL